MDDTSMTHPSPSLQELEVRDATRLAAMLASGAALTAIRGQLWPGRSLTAARHEALRCARSDDFLAALVASAPAGIRASARELWLAWRDQDPRVAPREQFRTLWRLVVDLDRLAATLRSLRSPAECAEPEVVE